MEVPRRDVLKGVAAAAAATALTQVTAAEANAAGSAKSCTTPGGKDFPQIGGNYGNQNYSALDDIHKGNVRRLGGAWVNRIEGGLNTGTNQSTAVAVDGVLYIESALGNVFAVDGRTGVTKWKYTQTRGTVTRRGVAVGDGKVFTHGKGNWVIALDQATGAVVWEKQILGYGTMEKVAITYHDGLLHLGTHDTARAAALAVSATDGTLVWNFWGIPGPGEFGHDTWEGDSWQVGGSTPWIHPALDPELGLIYWTFG
ncbi:MAG: PQQ-binding-like beta-propeller repeat protein, partial [Actinoplanes sp.]